MHQTRSTVITPLVIACLLVVSPTRALVALQPPPAPTTGADMFKAYCASCHGMSGRGDGTIAKYLRVPPADLTQIAKRNRGVFPTERVHRIIDGREPARVHGDAEMPVWGDTFKRSGINVREAEIRRTIDRLVAYVKSLQEKPAKP